jgi:hypothetical protein
LSIKFAVKVAACLALAGFFSSLSAQQTTTPPANSDSSGQTQSQSQTDGQGQPAPQVQPVPSDKNPSGQNPAQNPGEQTPDKTDQQSSSNKDQQQNTGGKVAGTSNDRLFYALPNFLTMEDQKLPPLTVKEKFKVVALGTFDKVNYPWWGLIAAISQANNSEPGYGQGWIGYAKRYGATVGDSSIENFMVGAVLPSVLRQDPRFYYSENGGAFKRTTYAVSRIFVTRGDSGKKQFNFSEVVGAAIAAGISTNAYHPDGTFVRTPTNPHEYLPSERTLGNTATVWVTQMGLDSITLVIKEFWPDIHRRVERRRMMRQSASSPANSSSTPASSPNL